MKIKRPLFALWFGTSVLFLSGCGEPPQATTNTEITQAPLTASGEVVSLNSASISPPSIRSMWQMKIQFMAPENSMVKEGDVLLKFDGQDLRTKAIEQKSQLDAAVKTREQTQLENEAQREELKLALAEAEMNFDKAKRLVEITDAATKEVERKKQRIDYEIAKENLALAQKKYEQFNTSIEVKDKVSLSKIQRYESLLRETQTSIKKLTVTAPKSGLVMYKADRGGEKVAIGDTVWMGRTVLTLPSLDKLAIKAEFDEPDTARLKIGAEVKITLEAYPELPFRGKIMSLGEAYSEKSSSNLSIVFDAQISMDNANLDITRPGMKAKIEVLEEA